MLSRNKAKNKVLSQMIVFVVHACQINIIYKMILGTFQRGNSCGHDGEEPTLYDPVLEVAWFLSNTTAC